MHRRILVLMAGVALCLAAGALGQQAPAAEPQPAVSTVLLQVDQEGIPGKEVFMFRGEMVPGADTGKQVSTESKYIYVLEGALVVEVEGRPAVTVKAGETTCIARGKTYIMKNPSATAPVKTVGFAVAEKGQALGAPVK